MERAFTSPWRIPRPSRSAPIARPGDRVVRWLIALEQAIGNNSETAANRMARTWSRNTTVPARGTSRSRPEGRATDHVIRQPTSSPQTRPTPLLMSIQVTRAPGGASAKGHALPEAIETLAGRLPERRTAFDNRLESLGWSDHGRRALYTARFLLRSPANPPSTVDTSFPRHHHRRAGTDPRPSRSRSPRGHRRIDVPRRTQPLPPAGVVCEQSR